METKMVGPAPQKYVVAEGQLMNVASAAFVTLTRGGCGAFAAGYAPSLAAPAEGDNDRYSVITLPNGYRLDESSAVGRYLRPVEQLVLYDLHGCPFCRKVREAVSILDLEVLFLPCPQGGPTWRPEGIAKSGKSQFPFLIDPNTGTELLESDAIVSYLFTTYGARTVPLGLRLGPLTALTAALGMLPRGGKGSRYRAARKPEKPLVVYSYEASPFCAIVKEVLGELELAHVQVSCARGSPQRQRLLDARGHFQAPFLEDPNTGAAMFESSAIIRYLEETYAVASPEGNSSSSSSST